MRSTLYNKLTSPRACVLLFRRRKSFIFISCSSDWLYANEFVLGVRNCRGKKNFAAGALQYRSTAYRRTVHSAGSGLSWRCRSPMELCFFSQAGTPNPNIKEKEAPRSNRHYSIGLDCHILTPECFRKQKKLAYNAMYKLELVLYRR